MKAYQKNSNLVGAWFQAIAFIISFAILSIFLTIRYHSFINLDPIYPLEINKDTNASTITVGIHIVNFNKFYVLQNIFEFVGTIWFAYDPSIISLDIIKKFAIHNGELIEVSEPNISQTAHKTIARFRIHAKFHSQLYYRLFPFDDHRINLIITNDFLPKNIIFSSSSDIISLDPSLYLPGWQIIEKTATSGYSEWLPDPTDPSREDISQKLVFSFLLSHANPMLTVNIIFTLLLLLFISLLTFSSEEDSVLIVTVGMVALIGYRFVMQALEPTHITYFTLVDYMYLFALIGTILTLFGGILARERHYSVMTKQWIIASIYALFVGGCSLISFIL